MNCKTSIFRKQIILYCSINQKQMLGQNQLDIRLIGSGSTATNYYTLHPRTDESVSLLSRQTHAGIWNCLAGGRLQSLLSRRGSLSQWSPARRSSCGRSRRPVARPVEECEAVRKSHVLSSSMAPRCLAHTCGLGREEEWNGFTWLGSDG